MRDQAEVLSASQSNQRQGILFGNRLVKIQFQIKFALMAFTLVFFSSAATWLIAKSSISTLIVNGYVTGEQSIASLRMINVIIAQTSFLAMLVTFLLAFFFSHYVAGPIYRFEAIFKQMKAGNLNVHVRLRDSDEFKETATAFNEALHALRNRAHKDRTNVLESIEKLKLLAVHLKGKGLDAEGLQLGHLIQDIENLPPQIKI